MALEDISLMLSAGQLSDLFFNYDHPARNKLYENRTPNRPIDSDELYTAILDDAKEFVATLGIVGNEATQLALDLANAFESRV